MQKKIHFIGIGGIGISALARYYLTLGYQVSGSDSSDSQLIHTLQNEGIDIHLDNTKKIIDFENIEKIIYTEAVPEHNAELESARSKNIATQTYPEALAEVVNKQKLITVAGTHGKSTTTALISLVLKNSDTRFSTIVGSLLQEFDGKNFFTTTASEVFVLEACEYKRSFLNYTPTVAVITNIELDHLDYYNDLDDYISAYIEHISHVVPGGFVLLNGADKNCKKLLGKRADLHYIELFTKYFILNDEEILLPEIEMQIPGKHILYDAHIAYIVGHMMGINDRDIIDALEDYTGIWRRMETIGTTNGGNILMSDYGHHPTEISLTLGALKEKHPDTHIYTLFQPHQYSRTLELLDDFIECFQNTDTLIIPDIYESRDSKADIQKINSEILSEKINHPNVIDGKGLQNSLTLLQKFDSNNTDAIILLLGAGSIDELRYKITVS